MSAGAGIGMGRLLRQQWGGLPTMAASSNPVAASCISELTLPTLYRWQLPNWNCQGVDSGDDFLLPGSLLTHATGFVAQELLVIVQIAVEGLDATLGDEPELVTYRAQQGPVVTDQHHCAFEFVECHA